MQNFLDGKSFYGVLVVAVIVFMTSCATTEVTTKDYSPEGNLVNQTKTTNNQIYSQLQRVFTNKVIEGIGIFENENEGLARTTAIQLAVNDLAAQVQTFTRLESSIYNNEVVRQLVETQVKALVGGYKVEFSGYDPGTFKYRVRLTITGEQLIKEIETRIK